jgi:CheY-like chemotaxis protein
VEGIGRGGCGGYRGTAMGERPSRVNRWAAPAFGLEEGKVADAAPGRKTKVLVVDDSAPNVDVLRLLLEEAGYEVIEAYSGREALRKLERERPAAMILDVCMPAMSGYDLCRAVRRDPEFSRLAVIMVTALAAPEDQVRGIEAGATHFMTKPLDPQELLARLRTSLVPGPRGEGAGADFPGP